MALSREHKALGLELLAEKISRQRPSFQRTVARIRQLEAELRAAGVSEAEIEAVGR